MCACGGGLLSYGNDGALRGELAEHWETDDEGWRFKLREAYFHNGNGNGGDVKWTIEQISHRNPPPTCAVRCRTSPRSRRRTT